MPVPKKSVKVKPGRGDAHFAFARSRYARSLHLRERDPPGWIGPHPRRNGQRQHPVDGDGERLKVDNDQAGFVGQYENANATIEWSAENADGYFFSTVNSSEINITHAFTAKVRNGVFHS